MSTPKLEVFQISLNRKKNKDLSCFFDLLIRKFAPEDDDDEIIPQTDRSLFKLFFESFITKLDEFVTDQKGKKAFTSYDVSLDDQRHSSIKMHSADSVIEGNIEGGPYGRRKNLSDLEDKDVKSPVTVSNVILDKFYFFLYIPMDSDIAILMLQSYTDNSIAYSFKDFLAKTFSLYAAYHKAVPKSFFPDVIKEEFRQGSTIKKFTFTKQTAMSEILQDLPVANANSTFRIKIELVADEDINRDQLSDYLVKIKDIAFGKEDNLENLEDYEGKVYLSKDSKETSFAIGADFDITPTIYLGDKIGLEDDGTPIWNELKDYCFELLPSIKQETYANYEIE